MKSTFCLETNGFLSDKPRSSAPASRMLRSSCRRISTEASAHDDQSIEQATPTTTECFVNEPMQEMNTPTGLVEMVTLPEEDENDQGRTSSMTLNLSSPQETEEFSTPTKAMMPTLSREYTYNTPTSRKSERQRSIFNASRATTNEEEPNSSMLNILLTKPTEAKESVRKSGRKATSIASKSMLGVLLTQPTEAQVNVPTPKRKSRSVAPLAQPTETEASVPTPKRKSRSVASKSMLRVLLTQPTEVQAQLPTPTRKSRSIASKSMLGVLLTQPTETEASEPTPKRQSRSIASKSMLGVLLTQPTEVAPSVETPKRSSSSIVSKSMLGVLLTEPTPEIPTPETPSISSNSLLGVLLTNPTIPASPISNTVRTSARSSVHPSPRVSINPLHSSTPAATRQKSLQLVSIGEQEQVSTIVPQTLNTEQEEIEIMRLNDTVEINEQAAIVRTLEMGVQTTPSIDVSSRRRMKTLEPQPTPITIVEEPKQMTPLQTTMVLNLQRNVRFQLTPTTDARLAAKEKLEENLRGLKPDIVIQATPVLPESKVEQVKAAPAKKAAKPKKKAVASKKKKAQPVSSALHSFSFDHHCIPFRNEKHPLKRNLLLHQNQFHQPKSLKKKQNRRNVLHENKSLLPKPSYRPNVLKNLPLYLLLSRKNVRNEKYQLYVLLFQKNARNQSNDHHESEPFPRQLRNQLSNE